LFAWTIGKQLTANHSFPKKVMPIYTHFYTNHDGLPIKIYRYSINMKLKEDENEPVPN
jgi:hypothetical protein